MTKIIQRFSRSFSVSSTTGADLKAATAKAIGALVRDIGEGKPIHGANDMEGAVMKISGSAREVDGWIQGEISVDFEPS